jgi:hypothetical protein
MVRALFSISSKSQARRIKNKESVDIKIYIYGIIDFDAKRRRFNYARV